MSLDMLKGKYVLLDFWATWCSPCMEQIPAIKKIGEKFPSDKLEIVGISADRDSSVFIKVIDDSKMDWIHVLDSKKDMRLLFGIEAFPTLILINPAGKIVYRKIGGIVDIEELERIIGN